MARSKNRLRLIGKHEKPTPTGRLSSAKTDGDLTLEDEKSSSPANTQLDLPHPPMSLSSLSHNPKHILFIASLGNPHPLHNTRHSAGHHVLHALHAAQSYPPFQRVTPLGRAQVSQGEDSLLWQSPSFMNVSGALLGPAWYRWYRDLREEDLEASKGARLVVLHDELELGLGQVKTRLPNASVKGHNGLKSLQAANAGAKMGGPSKFWRIGIGIGRPESREKGAVSDYVLKPMTPSEQARIEASVPRVIEELVRLRDE